MDRQNRKKSNLKVCFVGLGSIAKRHIRNLSKICSEGNIILTADVYRHGKGIEMDSETLSFIASQICDFTDVSDDYDIIFITNPTEYHIETLKRFHKKGRHFFIEKPFCHVNQLRELDLSFLRRDSVYYAACPLRYSKVISYVKENICPEDVLSVRSISSSYLPEWRPGIDYRNTYSATKSLGGGVSMDLIHEWDYLYYLFGKPLRVYSMLKKVTDLEIDTEDIAVYIGEYADKIAEVHLDYIGRSPVRKLELITREETIVCDFINSRIQYLKQGKTVELEQERNGFQLDELRYFLNLVQNCRWEKSNIIEAVRVLSFIQGETWG